MPLGGSWVDPGCLLGAFSCVPPRCSWLPSGCSWVASHVAEPGSLGSGRDGVSHITYAGVRVGVAMSNPGKRKLET